MKVLFKNWSKFNTSNPDARSERTTREDRPQMILMRYQDLERDGFFQIDQRSSTKKSDTDDGKVRFELLSQQVASLRRNQSLATESSKLPWVLTGRDLTPILRKSIHTLRILHAHRRGKSHQDLDFLGISRFFLDKHPVITYNYFKAT